MSYVVVQLCDPAPRLAAGPRSRYLVLGHDGGWWKKAELGRQFAEVDEARVALVHAGQEMESVATPQLEVRIFEHRVGGWWIGPRIWPDPEPVSLLGGLA